MTSREVRRALRTCPFEKAEKSGPIPEPIKIPEEWLGRQRRERVHQAVDVVLAVLAAVMVSLALMRTAHGETYTVQTESGCLNIRAKPWVGSEIIGWLYAGDEVDVISDSDGWALVTAPIEAGEGYVNMDFLSYAPQECGSYVVDAGGRVRVRKTPNGERVRWLEDGDTVNVTRWETHKGELWAYVGDGYVLGDCLEAVK